MGIPTLYLHYLDLLRWLWSEQPFMDDQDMPVVCSGADSYQQTWLQISHPLCNVIVVQPGTAQGIRVSA